MSVDEATMAGIDPPQSDAREMDVTYVVNPHLRVIRCTDDEVVIKRGTRSLFSEVIADGSRQHLLSRIIDRLRTPGSLADLIAEGIVATEFVDAANDAISYLVNRSVLVRPEDGLVSGFVETFMGPNSRLASATVGVIGSGQLAWRVTTTLQGLGVKQVIALDESERTQWSNRFATEAVGDEPTQTEIRAIPWIDKASYRRLFEDCDTVLVLLDQYSPSTLHAANEAAIATLTAWTSCFLDGNEGVVGPTYVPGESACYFEFELQTESSLTLTHEALLYKEEIERDRHPTNFVFGPHADVLAGFVVDSLLRFVTGRPAFTTDRALRVDFDRQSLDYQDAMRIPRCSACEMTRAPYRHPFL